jgi:hypothetical protein
MGLHASCPTDGTPAVPLREATTSRSAKEDDAQLKNKRGSQSEPPLAQVRLERSDVSGDFHSYGNDLGFGFGPRHDMRSA